MKKIAKNVGEAGLINFGFWKKVKENAAVENRPIFVLAPMADVTDAAFRRIIAKYSKMGKENGGPDVMWTEFVSADGLCSPGREVLLRDLAFSEIERPIVAQLFTSNQEKMKEAAKIVVELGFDGLDINMGCPDRSIEKQGAGAAMIKNPENAIAVIKAAREGLIDITDAASRRNPFFSERSEEKKDYRREKAESAIPVSVKTRIGYNKVDFDWIRILLEQKLPALTIHLRTRKEMSNVPAHWELMSEIVKLRNEISPETLIIGNGDVESLADACKKAVESGCDGIMFGRAIFGNPWLFDRKKDIGYRVDGVENTDDRQEFSASNCNCNCNSRSSTTPYTLNPTPFNKKEVRDKLRVMVEHTELFEKLLGDIKSFAIMKKHYKAYVSGWDGAKELRMKLMEAENALEVRKIIEDYLKQI